MPRVPPFRIVSAAVCLLMFCLGTAHAQEGDTVNLKRSDVVFMGPSAPDVYEQYGCTVVSWGGRPWGGTEAAINSFRARVEAAHDLGIRYLPGAAFRTAFAGMIDYDPRYMNSVCRSLEGEPITVPWLWDHEHKGNPAYWFCTNAPGYRDYLRYQMENAFVAGAEGLHIDDYAGTSGAHWAGGGCFCEHCMAGFREYLRENASPEELNSLGIDRLDDFDYGDYLRAQRVTALEFQRLAGAAPEEIALSHHFLAFQRQAAACWVAEYRQWAEGTAGHPLALCVNSAVSGPENLMIAPVVTFFSGEVDHEADSGELSTRPIWAYKLGDAAGRPLACTAAGWDWAFVNENNKHGLVRAWIAQAYAFGHQFMPPVRQWCYTKEKGTHWWEPSPAEFAPLTRFVRENAELLDGYESAARVGLIYSNAAFKNHAREAIAACSDLALMNVPFRIMIAGDDEMPARLDAAELVRMWILVYTEPHHLDAAQEATLDRFKQRLIRWPGAQKLNGLLPPLVRVDGAENVTTVPRVRPDEPTAPFICHLVNRNYDLETDSVEPQRDFRIRFSKSLFGRPIRGATIHAPGQDPVELEVRQVPGGAEVGVPELDLWAILRLRQN
jgi:hypothetical protein